MTLKLGVLISGRGSNLQAIIDAVAGGRLDATIELVVSNKRKAGGLERAAKAGIACEVINHRKHATREDFDAAVVNALRTAGVQWVVLAGFMRILTPVLLNAFPDRVINIHPSLLPAFPGLNAQQQAVDYGVCVSGCTVHLVNEGVDTGTILSQRVVWVSPDDTGDTLAARILEQEHALLPETLQAIAKQLQERAQQEWQHDG